ncbi:hypothetical protein HJFPF1_12653 [Paramyrothecium foliicola]|nr:hypothetical protein HJFPF1_12653 [Paramyrothecium foliicola]
MDTKCVLSSLGSVPRGRKGRLFGMVGPPGVDQGHMAGIRSPAYVPGNSQLWQQTIDQPVHQPRAALTCSDRAACLTLIRHGADTCLTPRRPSAGCSLEPQHQPQPSSLAPHIAATSATCESPL